MEKKVLYEKRDKIAYVTINRPEVHNCINVEVSNQLIGVWDEIKRDRDVLVAILTGAGDKAFSSGADLKELIPYIREESPEESRRRAYQGPGWGGYPEATKYTPQSSQP